MPLCAPLLAVLRRCSWASGLNPNMLSAFAIRPRQDMLAIGDLFIPKLPATHTFRSIKDTARTALRHRIENRLHPRRDLLIAQPFRGGKPLRVVDFLLFLPPPSAPPHTCDKCNEYDGNTATNNDAGQSADGDAQPIATFLVDIGG